MDSSQVIEVVIQDEQVRFTTNQDEKALRTVIPFYYKKELGKYLLEKGVRFKYAANKDGNIFVNILATWLPVLLIIGVWVFIFKQMQGGNKLVNVGQTGQLLQLIEVKSQQLLRMWLELRKQKTKS